MLDLHSRPADRSDAWRHPQFRCVRSMSAGVVRVTLGGELDIASVPQTDRALRLAEAAADVVVLDLRELELIESSGVHLVLEADRRIRRAGGRLTIVSGNAEIDWFFALLGLDLLLDVVDHPSGQGARSPNREPTFIQPEPAEAEQRLSA